MPFTVKARPAQELFKEVDVGTAGLHIENIGHEYDYFALRLIFTEQRGYGDRLYQIQIEPNTFKDLAEAMIRTNREVAIKAFGAALQVDTSQRIDQGTVWRPNAA